jgi:hypothetical protein
MEPLPSKYKGNSNTDIWTGGRDLSDSTLSWVQLLLFTYIPRFIRIGSASQLLGEIRRHHGDSIRLFLFFGKRKVGEKCRLVLRCSTNFSAID